MKKLLSPVLTVVVIAAFIIYFINNREAFRTLFDINVFSAVLIGLLYIVTIIISGLFTKYQLVPFKVNISGYEAFYTSILTYLGNFFTPARGGAGIRAVYLKKRFKLTYTNFLSTFLVTFIFLFGTSSLITLAVLVYMHLTEKKYSVLLYGLFSGLALFSVSAYFFRIPLKIKDHFKTSKNKVIRRILLFFEGWETATKNKGNLFKMALTNIIGFLISVFIFYQEIRSLNFSTGFEAAFILGALNAVSFILSVTPASLGTREVLLLAFSSMIGLSSENIMEISLLDRAAVYITLGLLYLYIKTPIHKKLLKQAKQQIS